jgi:hypothetical protein
MITPGVLKFLAALSVDDYAKVRQEHAETSGISVADLDSAVTAERERVKQQSDAEYLDEYLATDPSHVLANDLTYFQDDIIKRMANLSPADYDKRRKKIYKRLGFGRVSMFDEEVRKHRAPTYVDPATIDNLTDSQIRETLDALLFSTGTERRRLGLPEAEEAATRLAEEHLWKYINNYSDIFVTETGQGYFLLYGHKERPIPVRKGGDELNDFLTGLGIHSGSRVRDRIGKHLGAMCWRYGKRTEPRVSFHYDANNFVAYFTEAPGKLIRVSEDEITRVDNGDDEQLFIFPRNYESWHLDLDNLPAPSDFCPDFEALLPNLLFSVLQFENESLNADDIGVLLNAYIATLFLPGIVSGKLLLQVLGESGSAKTLFLRLLGRLIYGRRFEVTGMDTDEKEVENIVVNNAFVVFDDVKRTSNSAILGIIRRACTGGTCIRRELYSNFKQVSEPYRAAVALSCSDEPFNSTDEMSNRSLIIRAKAREDYLDEKEFLQRIDANRNQLMAEMMVRLQGVIAAVKTQSEYKPVVQHRMASFATFLLRVSRNSDWEPAAKAVLESWKEEQEGSSLDESIVTAMTKFISSPTWERNRRYSASELYKELSKVSFTSNPWWLGKEAALIRALHSASRAYLNRFGFHSERRTSGHRPPSFWFEPSDEVLKDIQRCRASSSQGDEEPPF